MDQKVIILYEDAELIVCRKPSGIPVQSARIGQKDMVSILNNYFAEGSADRSVSGEKKQAAGRERPSVYVVHRLDQPVEGVLVFAKTKQSAAGLSRQAADGRMEKVYRAVCCVADRGRDSSVFGEGCSFPLVDYLVRDGRTNTSSVAEKGTLDAKRAELVFSVKCRRMLGQRAQEYLLAEIRLKTGRHHQIRVQMAHAGLPLYGDRKYNERWRDFSVGSEQSGDCPALCAVSLAFSHPSTGRRMKFQTEPEAGIFRYFAKTDPTRTALGE